MENRSDIRMRRLAFGGAFLFSAIFSLNAIGKDSTWGAVLGSTQRYQALQNFNNTAVLDRETGLVWEACPDTSTTHLWGSSGTSADAFTACYNKTVGGRLGWRLPTVEEIQSLGDPATTPFLPHNNPFCTMDFPSGGHAPGFWTATTTSQDNAKAYAVGGCCAGNAVPNSKTLDSNLVWCVRGGTGHDPSPASQP